MAGTPQLYFEPQILAREDGTFVVKPGRPQLRRETVSVSQAVKRFGMSVSSWNRLLECGLVEGFRPTPKKIFLFVDSIEKHLKATEDEEFWDHEGRRERYNQVIGSVDYD